MTGIELRTHRRESGWTQARLASRLGLTQAYVSLMERGRRPVPRDVATAVVGLLRLPATALPFSESAVENTVPEAWIERALARLGYPGFAYRKTPGPRRNPAEVLLNALAREDLDPRLVEALPWLLLEFDGIGTDSLVIEAKRKDLQNRLGFVVGLAREVAAQNPRWRHRADPLRLLGESLEPVRLAREDRFGAEAGSERLREWLRRNRTKAASHWNLLTDLRKEHLPYAGEDRGAMARLPA